MDRNENDINITKTAREKARQFLLDHYDTYGHFAIFEYYPTFEIKKDKQWHYTYSSPFLHANVMYALMNADPKAFKEILKKGAAFLIGFKEPGDLWRFWNVNECEHPVFCGVDDTAISSIVLQKLNHQLKNTAILNSRIRKDGAVLTWIKPDLKLFLINPFAYLWMKYLDRYAASTINYWGWISYDDAEPSITANVLAYLGENEKTLPVLEYVINAWNNDSADNYMYYEKKIIFCFHLARAYKEGCKSLDVLKKSIAVHIENELNNFVFAELLMAYLSISYYEGEEILLKKIQHKILSEINSRDAFTDNYPYITAKNRVYFGGAGALTAAWFLEATNNWCVVEDNRRYSTRY